MKNQLTIALTLDDDAESGFIDAGFSGRTALSRGAYGAFQGTKRILDLFKRHQLPLTCYIPGVTAERFPDPCKMMRDAGCEIGLHGYTHKAPDKMTLEEERAELERGIKVLEDVLGVRPKGYRAPWLRPSHNTYSLLMEHGFEYDASECGLDRPYFLDVNGKHFLEIPGQLEWIDTPLFINLTAEGFPPAPVDPNTVKSIWSQEFLGMYDADEDLYLVHTIHPWCIGHLSRLKMYEEFICFVKDHHNVTFMTMHQISEKFYLHV